MRPGEEREGKLIPQGKPKKRSGSAFIELLSIFLHLDHRLPLLEASAFLFFSSVLLFSSVSNGDDSSAFSYMAGFAGLSLTSLIFVALILKNLASGWGNDFEKGTMQTFLIYPLSRGKVFLARLVSSLLVPLVLLALAQFSAVFLIAPGFALASFEILLLGFLASLTTPLLIAVVVVLAVLWAKSGGVPFALGLVAYFSILIFSSFLLTIGYSTGNSIIVWATYFINPVYAFSNYFGGRTVGFGFNIPVPTYDQAIELLAANLLLSLALLSVGAFLFAKRTEA
jgi:ABC-type transport system involved in multi-copper enzyme maturation permease subunit